MNRVRAIVINLLDLEVALPETTTDAIVSSVDASALTLSTEPPANTITHSILIASTVHTASYSS
jgi:hypothetical protein